MLDKAVRQTQSRKRGGVFLDLQLKLLRKITKAGENGRGYSTVDKAECDERAAKSKY